MLRQRMFGVVVAATIAAGCATMNVSSHVERGMDFSQFGTFDWGPADALPTGDPRLDNNPFFRDYLTGAVERELAGRGYRLASDSGPHLLMHFHANVSQRFEVHGMEPSNYPNCYPNCEPAVAEYEDGTIVIDAVDAATGNVVWRGWAQDNVRGLLDDQDAMQRHIERSVRKMFERFPRGPLAPVTTR
jgi:hypothetical protein